MTRVYSKRNSASLICGIVRRKVRKDDDGGVSPVRGLSQRKVIRAYRVRNGSSDVNHLPSPRSQISNGSGDVRRMGAEAAACIVQNRRASRLRERRAKLSAGTSTSRGSFRAITRRVSVILRPFEANSRALESNALRRGNERNEAAPRRVESFAIRSDPCTKVICARQRILSLFLLSLYILYIYFFIVRT